MITRLKAILAGAAGLLGFLWVFGKRRERKGKKEERERLRNEGAKSEAEIRKEVNEADADDRFITDDERLERMRDRWERRTGADKDTR